MDEATKVVDGVLSKVFGLAADAAVDVRHGSEREARAAAARVAEIRSTIEPVVATLSPDGKPVQDDDGDYVLDSATCGCSSRRARLPGPPPPIIRVFAITNAEVTLSSELGLFLSRAQLLADVRPLLDRRRATRRCGSTRRCSAST